ncbi:hypothetical protein EJ05DRAFT_458923 [Pseudovirgaria hyperparasitica]|uniref:Uncharacterized protein n=1 Tax=Pseudovirgaria hyperparasitica TaxID=470096 RepID=A0A6A6VSF1_9PEZI|nr:uncharacterized protein EJ05DRAFT_458923 [Pseudovirgaria hyperparasitica]KAF2752684.1 hypothetical protein EJ05DRAFT_458923 [Pseudovirgaria hyperparasitica]
MHAERLNLWEDFNHCWLTALQRQKEITEESLESGQRPRPTQTLMGYDQLENLGRELVRLCDLMEKPGLVDYQMGVWEEEIISMLTACLDLIEDQPRGSTGSTARGSIPPTSRQR